MAERFDVVDGHGLGMVVTEVSPHVIHHFGHLTVVEHVAETRHAAWPSSTIMVTYGPATSFGLPASAG